MIPRVLIIGRGLFRDGLNRLLSDHESVEVVAAVSDWREARRILEHEPVDTLIVEQQSTDDYEDELLRFLATDMRRIKVIYLSLAKSQMIVHQRRQMSDVTVENLLTALGIHDQRLKINASDNAHHTS